MPSSKKEQRSGQDSVKMDDAGVGVAGREAEADEPRDARVVRELLRSMGVGEGEYEPRVLHQFLELCYRYVVDVLSDAQVYAEHAGKSNIDPDDVRLAIQSKINFSFSQPPPREVLLELARTRNKTPLPKTIAPPGSIPLPPEQDTLVSPNYQLLIPKKQLAQIEETEEDEDEKLFSADAGRSSTSGDESGAVMPTVPSCSIEQYRAGVTCRILIGLQMSAHNIFSLS